MTTKNYVVNCVKLPLVVGRNPVSGIDLVDSANRGEQVELDPNAARTKKLLAKKYIRPEGEMSDADAARAAEEQKAAENRTNKQKLQDRAAQLGIAFEDKTTIPQLEALIAEEEEKRKDAAKAPKQNGEDGDQNPDAAK